MEWSGSVRLVLVHCQGEIGRVVVAGAPDIPGATLLDQMTHINTVDDRLRRFLAFEPRGGLQMSTNLLVPPHAAGADAGFIVLQPDRAHPMSGSNCICVVTALLETGRVAMMEPETTLLLDTPAGLIAARARCAGGRCLSVSLDNVACFVEALGTPIGTSRWGRVAADIAFGGVYYAIVDAKQVGLAIVPGNAGALAAAGMELKSLIAERVSVRHPELRGVDEIAYVMFRAIDDTGALTTATAMAPGRLDRSPCGTGSSAQLAVMHARGTVRVGDHLRSRSIIGGEFLIEAIGETTVGNHAAVLPRVTGQGWVYGREELRTDPADPFPVGFTLSDTWGLAASSNPVSHRDP